MSPRKINGNLENATEETRLRTLRVGGLLLALILGLMPQSCQTGVEDVSDSDISGAVKREFIHDPAVLASQVQVASQEGVVTLRGTVETILARDRAERIAETVKGVRSVNNLIVVEPTEDLPDSVLERRVENALFRDPATDSWEIQAAVNEGNLTLEGTVDSWTERDLARVVASGVVGLAGIRNEIEVDPPLTRDDLEIEREIEKALQWSTLVDDALIRVGVVDGKVILQGFVGSAAEKRQARREALVPGVTGVDDSRLAVARWARDEDLRADKYLKVSDPEIEAAVEQALHQNPRLSGTDVSASVHEGIVTLQGSVETVKALRDAIDIAHSTVGVQYVENQLAVRPRESGTDAEIAERIRSALEESVFVDESGVDVTVQDGVASLSGSVESRFQRIHLDEVASRVRGVREVLNDVQVTEDGIPLLYDPFVWDFDPTRFPVYELEPATTEIADDVIEGAVKDELYWSPFVNGQEIEVSVENGIVTLQGTVTTPTEKSFAIQNAYEGGAVRVEDELTIAHD